MHLAVLYCTYSVEKEVYGTTVSKLRHDALIEGSQMELSLCDIFGDDNSFHPAVSEMLSKMLSVLVLLSLLMDSMLYSQNLSGI